MGVRRLLPSLVGVALLAALPLVVRNSFYLHVCILVLMWTVLGAAWNVLGGFAGQVSFGHAALFAILVFALIITRRAFGDVWVVSGTTPIHIPSAILLLAFGLAAPGR